MLSDLWKGCSTWEVKFASGIQLPRLARSRRNFTGDVRQLGRKPSDKTPNSLGDVSHWLMRHASAIKKNVIHPTHLTIKKTIKYSHNKALKDKRTVVTGQQFQLLNGNEASQGKSDSLPLPLEAQICCRVICSASFSYFKEAIAYQILPGMIQEPIQKTAEFPLYRCLHPQGKKQRWYSAPRREGWGGVLTLQVSWEWKQRRKLM